LELLPKTLLAFDICLKYKDKTDNEITQELIIKEIYEEIKKDGHNLESLYKKFNDLMILLNIEDVQQFPPQIKDINKDYFVWEYLFKIKGIPNEIRIKNVEAIRYGSFSKNSDVYCSCVNDQDIINLLNNIYKYVSDKEEEAGNILLQRL
jgi:hypothetical protein